MGRLHRWARTDREGRWRDWGRWHSAHHAVRRSLRWRMVLLFLVLALALAGTFIFGMQKALSFGWRDAARPLLADYVDRLAAEIGSPPSIERARALTARLPLAVRITGPAVNWQFDAKALGDPWHHGGADDAGRSGDAGRHAAEGALPLTAEGSPLLERATADGHRIQFGLSVRVWQNRPGRVGWITLAVLLLLTALAHAYVRRTLRPLDDIRDGAQRFGRGEFAKPIPIRRNDELGQLAADVNEMAGRIHQMLEAKRGLLLAISHELRSPLTRARLNTELLPETGEVHAQRQALLRDLAEMRDLVVDLLESERLGQGHAALHLEDVDLGALAREVVASLATTLEGDGSTVPEAGAIRLRIDDNLPRMPLDLTRMRLLLRNLLDNALRHNAGASAPVELSLSAEEGDRGSGAGVAVVLSVRDHGAGVDEAVLPHLAEPFYRPDAARERATGGVGLGLYLCKLVALAHGASFELSNARPGLRARVRMPK